MKFLIIISIFLSILSFLNAECQVNGYYRSNGTYVDGYTKSGDCWQGDVKNYDAQGRSAKDRMKERRKYFLLLIPIFVILSLILIKIEEDSRLAEVLNWIVGLLGLYFMIIIFSDTLLMGVFISIGIIYYYTRDSWFIKKISSYFEKQNSSTLNVIFTKYQEKEFSSAIKKLKNIDEVSISRELSVVLYKNDKRSTIFINEIFVVFESANYGIIIKKKNGKAIFCYLVDVRNIKIYNNARILIESFPD